MLAVSRYHPQTYPPPGFPTFSRASGGTPTFKRLQDAKANSVLQGMIDRKKGSTDILQQRAAPFQSAQSASTLATPSPAPSQLATPEHFQIYHDPDSGHESDDEATHSESEPSPGLNLLHATATRVSAASSALASGASAAGSALDSGGLQMAGAIAPVAYNAARTSIGYATVGSQMALVGGIHAGIHAANARGVVGAAAGHVLTQGAIAVAPPLASGASAIGNGLGHGMIGAARGGAAIANAGHHVATQHLIPAVASVAQAAVERGIPAAQAALSSLSYRGSDAFHALLDHINTLPAVPSLELHHTGNTLATSYLPLRNKRRSASPSAPVMFTPHAAPVTPAAFPSNYVTYNTPEERRQFSTGRAILGEQLKLRPQLTKTQTNRVPMGEHVS